MSLVDNITGQRNLINNISETKIKDELKKLRSEIENINSNWSKAASDKRIIINALNKHGNNIAKLCTNYKNYRVNALGICDVIELFGKLTKFVTKPVKKETYTVVGIAGITNGSIYMNPIQVISAGKRIKSIGQRLIDLHVDYNGRIAQLDDYLKNISKGKISDIHKINTELNKEGLALMKIGNAIIQIVENYKKAEQRIDNNVKAILEGKSITSGSENANSSSSNNGNNGGNTYNLPVASEYVKIPNSKIYKYNNKKYNLLSLAEIYKGSKYTQKSNQSVFQYSCCFATAASIYWSIVENKEILGNSSRFKTGKPDNKGKYLQTGGGASVISTKNYYGTLYDRLAKGKPTMCKFGVGSNQHWVTIVGVVEGGKGSSASDFLCVDPVDGTIKSLKAAIDMEKDYWESAAPTIQELRG